MDEGSLTTDKENQTESILLFKDLIVVNRFRTTGTIIQLSVIVLHLISVCFLARELTPATAAIVGTLSIISLLVAACMCVCFMRDSYLINNKKRKRHFMLEYGQVTLLALVLKIMPLIGSLITASTCNIICSEWKGMAYAFEITMLVCDLLVFLVIIRVYIHEFVKSIVNGLISCAREESNNALLNDE